MVLFVKLEKENVMEVYEMMNWCGGMCVFLLGSLLIIEYRILSRSIKFVLSYL